MALVALAKETTDNLTICCLIHCVMLGEKINGGEACSRWLLENLGFVCKR
jgi:hypothetical protein